MGDRECIKLDIESFDELKELETAHFGAYFNLVVVFLNTKKPVKERDFEQILNVNPHELLAIKEALIAFFDVENDAWTPKKDHLYRDLGGENG